MEKRTAHKSKEAYEDSWNEALIIMEKDLKKGDRSVNEILDKYHQFKLASRFQNKLYCDVLKKLGLGIKRHDLSQKRLVVRNGSYLLEPLDIDIEQEHILIDILANFIHQSPAPIDCVVELGSGIGRNLFSLANRLDPGVKKRIQFFSCEFTDSGKKACRELLKLSNDLNMSIEHFDYYHPNFSFLPHRKNILFFTSHSIEQIPILNPKNFTAMLESSAGCYCYHAEPVGWQYDKDLREQRNNLYPNNNKKAESHLKRKLYKMDRWIFKKYRLSLMDTSKRIGIHIEKGDIDTPANVSDNSARWSSARDYNTNLVSLIKKMDAEGLIKIDAEKINLYGKNPFNPTTIISWHKVSD